MSFNSLMRAITYARDSAYLVTETVIATTVSVTYQPSEPCVLQLELSGGSVFGDCLITGTDANDSVISEHFIFTQDDTRISQYLFKTITGITTAGFTGGNFSIKGALRSGELLNTRRTQGTIYGRIYGHNPDAFVHEVGAVQEQPLKLMCRAADSALQKGDYLTDGSIVYKLEADLHPVYGASTIHHYESIVTRLES